MGVKLRALTKSMWAFHLSTGSCNNCDIEVLDLFTPKYDVERFGIILVGSIRHADALVITGSVTKKALPRLKKLYEQIPKPCVVVACGACGSSSGMFRDGYNTAKPVDEIIPVDVYVPGCPPKPEALIAGIAKLIKKVGETKK